MILRPIRVLLIEDLKEDAELLMLQLKRGGYNPSFERVDSRDGLEQALQKSKWDLILSDYSLPQFSALDGLRMVRDFDQDIPFIIV